VITPQGKASEARLHGDALSISSSKLARVSLAIEAGDSPKQRDLPDHCDLRLSRQGARRVTVTRAMLRQGRDLGHMRWPILLFTCPLLLHWSGRLSVA
jgi:hypothetical protein